MTLVAPAAAWLSKARKFIDGLPMKSATKRVAGRADSVAKKHKKRKARRRERKARKKRERPILR